MNQPSEDIKSMLVADTPLGLIFATNLFINDEPTKPDNCVTIFDSPGFPPSLSLDGSKGYESPSVQIRIRNNSSKAGWALIQNIMISLHGRAQQTWGGTLYTVIYCSNGPALLDWDGNGNARFIVNFSLQRRTA
jgi:hypothetical protein